MRGPSSTECVSSVFDRCSLASADPFAPNLVVLELGALSIALVVLFSDSMESLFPTVSSTMFKLMFFFM